MSSFNRNTKVGKFKVLVLEDEVSMNRGIAFSAEKNGFDTVQCYKVSEAENAVMKDNVDVIICDINLPDGNGLDFIRAVREMESIRRPYIICLTVLDTETDHVLGYEAGADDYVVKPFSLSVLMLKLEAFAKRNEVSETESDGSKNVFLSGKLLFNPERMEARIGGRNISLTRNECKLLNVFLRNPGQVLSKNQLLEQAFDIYDNYVDENTLAVNISRLREKLCDDAVNPVFIKNVRGLGYIWTEEVR